MTGKRIHFLAGLVLATVLLLGISVGDASAAPHCGPDNPNYRTCVLLCYFAASPLRGVPAAPLDAQTCIDACCQWLDPMGGDCSDCGWPGPDVVPVPDDFRPPAPGGPAGDADRFHRSPESGGRSGGGRGGSGLGNCQSYSVTRWDPATRTYYEEITVVCS